MNTDKKKILPDPLQFCMTATKPVDELRFVNVEEIMNELLDASVGLQQLGELTIASSQKHEAGYLIVSMGKYIQSLRNNAARELNPIYESFDARPIVC